MSVSDLALDLDEHEPDVVQRIAHRRVIVAEPLAQSVDEACDRVDGEYGLVQVRRGRRQVDRRQLVEAHHVVGHDDFSRDVGEALSSLLHGPFGVGQRVGGFRVEVVGVEAGSHEVVGVGCRGFVTHVRYPTEHN